MDNRCLVAGLLVVAVPVHAARPLITDDVHVVERKGCRIESWFKSGPTQRSR